MTGVALPGDRAGERRRLPARTIAYWRLRSLLFGVLVVGLLTWWAAGVDWFNPTVRWAVVSVAALWFFGLGAFLAPVVRQRVFWYALSDNEIDLQHGWWQQVRTVVPMSRVQHLKSEQGPLARRFALSDLVIHTAAGSVSVAALDQDEAARLRRAISAAANLADDV